MTKQLFFLFLLFSFSLNSQDFNKVDELVKNYPRFTKVEDLASKINIDFSSDAEKARAAFFWLTRNIRYNLKELYNPTQRSYRFRYASEVEKEKKLQEIKDKLVADTFKNKTGVCEEYAQSFKKICDLLHIESEVIKGTIRIQANEIGKISRNTNHAWNAVKIDKKWLLLDATWAAGYRYKGKWIRDFNDYFYNIPKNKIFKTHYPEDSIWFSRFGSMSLKEFYNQPIYTNSFLALNADLIYPQKGIITLKSGEDLQLKFRNLNTKSLIFYTLKGVKYAQKPVISSEGNIAILTIKNPKINTNLVLYINKQDALHFKIRVK